MSTFDLIIRNGTIVDGSGGEVFQGDVAIDGGRIVEVGSIAGRGREEIDATGLHVMPGFVDIHTHFDGQVTWENRLTPCSDHGVTTVVMGNCGVGFAPCRPQDRQALISLMEGVEDIPGLVMAEGIPWLWETFPEYLDFLAARSYDIDIAAQIPHAPLRVYAMGRRGIDREPATAADRAAMAALAREAVEAGALGFSTSRSIFHRSKAGDPIPTLDVGEQELHDIAAALKQAGRGVLQANSDFFDGADDVERFSLMRRLAENSGRPLSFTLAQFHWSGKAWRHILDLLEQANADGVPMKGQVISRPMGGIMSHRANLNPFTPIPAYQELSELPFRQKIAALRQPEIRAQILAQWSSTDADFLKDPRAVAARNFDMMFPLNDPPDYDPGFENSIARLAQAQGIAPQEYAYDLLLERDGEQMILQMFANYLDGGLDAAREMMVSPATLIGLADGGAHYALLCDASQPSYLLTYWARDRSRGEKLPLPWIVKAMSHDTAVQVGLHDRGLIAPGYKADINLIDLQRLTLRAPVTTYDLPAGGQRLAQHADGYAATIVSGVVVLRDGERTGALPGRLVRGAQPAPSSGNPASLRESAA